MLVKPQPKHRNQIREGEDTTRCCIHEVGSSSYGFRFDWERHNKRREERVPLTSSISTTSFFLGLDSFKCPCLRHATGGSGNRCTFQRTKLWIWETVHGEKRTLPFAMEIVIQRRMKEDVRHDDAVLAEGEERVDARLTVCVVSIEEIGADHQCQ